jgi:hypothetical protein
MWVITFIRNSDGFWQPRWLIFPDPSDPSDPSSRRDRDRDGGLQRPARFWIPGRSDLGAYGVDGTSLA